MLEHEGSLINEDIEIGLLVCLFTLLTLFIVQAFVAGSGGVVAASAIATGFLGLAVAGGPGGSLGGPFLSSPFSFAFWFGAGRSRWVAVVVTFAASSSSFARWSSLTLRVFSLSLSLVGVVKQVGIIAEFLFVVGQVIELEVWILLKAAMSVQFDQSCKGKCAVQLFV